MLSKLVAVSIRFRGAVLAIACLVIGYGIYSAWHARFDVYPEFAPPQVVIQTEAPGLSPESVEQLVTRVVENALNGAPHVEAIRSQSIQGLSVVTVVFEGTTEVYKARQIANERLAEAATQLPQGVSPLPWPRSLVRPDWCWCLASPRTNTPRRNCGPSPNGR